MLKITLFVICLAFIYEFSFCQSDTVSSIKSFNPPILSAKEYKEGVYKDFNEFLSNSPSVHLNLIIDKNDLIVYDTIGKKILNYYNEHWGVCLKNKIYIKRDFGGYMVIRALGKYSLFSYIIEQSQVSNISSAYKKEIDYLLNLETNEMIRLNVNSLTKILKKEDIELLSQFNKENEKKSELFRYLNMLNERLRAN